MKKNNSSFGRNIFSVMLVLMSGFILTGAVRANSVSLSATPTSRTVFASKKTTYTININRTNFTNKVTLTVISGLPANATATFSPNITTANSSTLTVQTQTNTPAGNYILTIKGNAENIVIPALTVQLQVNPLPTVSVALTPPNQSIVAGQATFADISISRANFSGNVTLSAQNVPTGVTVQFDPPVTSGNSSRMYIYSNGLPFTSANYDMIVRGTGSVGAYGTAAFQLRVNPGIVWADQFGTPNNQTFNPDFATDVVYDAGGNVYLTGYTFSNVAMGETDAWVAKYNASGTRLWLQTIAGLTKDRPTDVFVNPAGQVFIAGHTLIANTANMDIFAVKFDANGNRQGNILTFGTMLEEGSGGMQFGLNGSGNVILTAPTHIARTLVVFDRLGNETFVAEYSISRYTFDANFNATSMMLVTTGVGNPKDIAVGSDDSLYVLSENRSQRVQAENLAIVNSRVEKFRSPLNQNYQSAVIGPTITSPTHFFASRLKVDANGNVFAIGNEYDRFTRVSLQNAPLNSWMVKLNGVGAKVWETEILSYFPTEISALDLDVNGDVYFAGNTWDNLRGTNPNPGGQFEPTARTDAWFAKYSGATGTPIFLNQFNVGDKDGFNAVKVGAPNGLNTPLYFAGYTVAFKNVNFGFEDGLLLRCSTLYCGYQP